MEIDGKIKTIRSALRAESFNFLRNANAKWNFFAPRSAREGLLPFTSESTDFILPSLGLSVREVPPGPGNN